MKSLSVLAACASLLSEPQVNPHYQWSLTQDFQARDRLPQTLMPQEDWQGSEYGWGPWPINYPKVQAPLSYEQVVWQRDRIVSVAKKYQGLPYEHRHIPAMGGLDCSNFTAWVYNYGLGIALISNIQKQAQTAGRKLLAMEQLQPGDLIFTWDREHTRIAHVVIYLDNNYIIDAHNKSVAIRPFTGWYRERAAWARRIIE